MKRLDWLRALVERALPWYDVAAERARDLRSESIHRESRMARASAAITITNVRRAYRAAGLRFER